MKDLVQSLKSALLSGLVFVLVFTPFLLIPGAIDFNMDFHGWGWAVWMAVFVGIAILVRLIGGVLGELVKGTRFAPGETATTFIDRAAFWVCSGLSFVIASHLAPSLVVCGSAVKVLLLALALGTASALGDAVADRVVGKK